MQPTHRKKSLRSSIIHLLPGEQLSVSAEKVEAVRSMASTLGLALHRKYMTRTDRETSLITITRLY